MVAPLGVILAPVAIVAVLFGVLAFAIIALIGKSEIVLKDEDIY